MNMFNFFLTWDTQLKNIYAKFPTQLLVLASNTYSKTLLTTTFDTNLDIDVRTQ